MWCCVWCGMADENMSTILRHIDSEHTPNAPVRCKYCNIVCHSMHDMDNHYATSQPETVPALCPECPKICHNKTELINHMKSHRNEDRIATESDLTYICHLCGILYKDIDNFNSHTVVCEEAMSPIEIEESPHTEFPQVSSSTRNPNKSAYVGTKGCKPY